MASSSEEWTKRLPPPNASSETWAPVLPRVRIGMPVAEMRGVAAAPMAAAPRKSRLEIPIDASRPTLSRIAEEVKHDRAAVRARAVLEDVNTLPRAEREA